ncbi:MAG: hypothetical protein KFF73_11120 [Cyclobacteriaceae bacterium]|nr:hypothetical protein [Cyclobacteriaceae bacterium]
MCLVSQDNYYRSRKFQPFDENGYQNFDMPGSIDLEQMVENVKTLRNGKSVEVEEYPFNNPLLPGKKLIIHPAPVIILEGIFIMHNADFLLY